MSDVGVYADATYLTFWNVKVPSGFFAALPNLEFLDIRGGSASNLEALAGLTRLRALVLNQIRGLSSLDELSDLVGLEFLSLYGLTHVQAMPSLRRLTALRRLEIGQMRSLSDLSGAAEAPRLEELFLLRKLAIDPSSMQPFLNHPTLRAFQWFWEDVPVSRAMPVVEVMSHLPQADILRPEEWLGRRPRDGA